MASRRVAIDVARSGSLESLSAEAEVGGDYRLTARAPGAGTLTGSYVLRVEMRSPTAEDKQRITAERLMIEAKPLMAQGSTAPRAIERFEQALALWRGLGDRYFEARTLYFKGRAYTSFSQHEKASEYFGQALAIYRELKNRQGEVIALNYLGVTNHRLSRYEKAIEYLSRRSRSRATRRISPIKELFSTILAMPTGRSANTEGHRDYLQSISIASQVEDRQGQAASLPNLGMVFLYLSRYEKAIESFERGALARTRTEEPDLRGEFTQQSGYCLYHS